MIAMIAVITTITVKKKEGSAIIMETTLQRSLKRSYGNQALLWQIDEKICSKLAEKPEGFSTEDRAAPFIHFGLPGPWAHNNFARAAYLAFLQSSLPAMHGYDAPYSLISRFIENANKRRRISLSHSLCPWIFFWGIRVQESSCTFRRVYSKLE